MLKNYVQAQPQTNRDVSSNNNKRATIFIQRANNGVRLYLLYGTTNYILEKERLIVFLNAHYQPTKKVYLNQALKNSIQLDQKVTKQDPQIISCQSSFFFKLLHNISNLKLKMFTICHFLTTLVSLKISYRLYRRLNRGSDFDRCKHILSTDKKKTFSF